ncbi:MAG: PQQ-binding-like beta-propeller repeat protein [Anaerolineales bacterium]|nr:PQQ-binding-like beta-propeller repeat protein [Anaerolineales bacterium]
MFPRVLIIRIFSALLVFFMMSSIASAVLASQIAQDHTVALVATDYWSMYGHDSAHSSWSSTNGPNSPDLAWVYPDEIVGDVVVGPDGTIYGSSYGPSILRAINPDGTLKWEWPAGFAETINHLAVVENAVYAVVGATDSTFYAFNPTDGSVLWSYPMNRVSYSNPTIGLDGTIYIASQLGDYHIGGSYDGGYLYAIRPNGTLKWIWNSGTPNCGIESSAAIGPNGNIYLQHNCRGLVALDSNGQFIWEKGGGQLGQPWNSPSVGPDGTIYIGSSDYTFRALNPDGSEKWQVTIDGWMYSSSSAVSANGSTIYRGDNSGGFYAFDSQGFVKWKFESGWGIFEPPTLSANGIVYFTQSLDSSAGPGDKAYLYALRAADGALLWKYELGQDGGTPVIGPNGTLYVTREQPSGNSYVNHLYAFQCADGKCAIPLTATFTDVPLTYWANSYIERLYNAGITGGCITSPSLMYCPDATVTRAQMAVFLLKGMHGSSFTPPAVGASTGFTDVAIDYWAAAWIKQLAAEGITGGCGAGIYCPDSTVTRAQMAIFLLKAKHGSGYTPPNATGVFSDVPLGYWADKWIEQLAAEGITGGCGAGVYCPDSAVTRAQMAVFLVKAFDLP